VGKTTLIANAVRAVQVRRGRSDEDVWGSESVRHRFWITSAGRLVSGMQYLGEWEERCERIIDELSSIDGVLCVESLAELVRVGGDDPSASVAAFLVPYLQSGELRLISEATSAEFAAIRRLLPPLAQLFEIVRLDELGSHAVRSAVTRATETAARDRKLDVDQKAVDATVRMYKRFLPYRPSPGSAVGFLRSVIDEAERNREMQVAPEHVVIKFIDDTGLPHWLLDDDAPMRFEAVFDWFQQRVVGQPDACRRIAQLVCTFKAGLNDPQRPIASLLFCGPTGVGKTQLAKSLSQYLFGHGAKADRLVRLDMSEYALPHQADRLITRANGMPSEFIERVRRQPFVVVLLDEVEKAADNVFDVLLALLDEGRLTDRFGRVTWFRSAIVIMTSNLGASANQSIGFSDERSGVYEREVRSFFRPEFFNRLDGVVTFNSLDQLTCVSIARLELQEVATREGLVKRGIQLRFADSIVDWIVQHGFDPRFGARPLQRVIQSRVVSPVSRFLVENPALKNTVIQANIAPGAESPSFQLEVP
jgi:ATP-dependent Clp protease ATP-binding subunit ClpC